MIQNIIRRVSELINDLEDMQDNAGSPQEHNEGAEAPPQVLAAPQLGAQGPATALLLLTNAPAENTAPLATTGHSAATGSGADRPGATDIATALANASLAQVDTPRSAPP